VFIASSGDIMSVDRLPAHHLEEWDEYCDAMVQDAMCLFPEDENVATRGDQIVQHGGEHKTGWMNLPRELRDAIYEYAVVSDSVRVIHHTRTKAITADRSSMRIWERRPRLCKAIPLFHEEILEAYYRLNAFKMGCKLVHKHLFLLKWAKQAGKPFTEHLGHLQLGLGRIANLQYSHPWPPANLKVDAFLVGRSLKVKLTSGSNRAYCSCDVLGQSEKRLLEDDICNDPDWQQRLQDTASYGPVLRFALKVLEIARLELENERLRRRYERPQPLSRRRTRCTDCGEWVWPSLR